MKQRTVNALKGKKAFDESDVKEGRFAIIASARLKTENKDILEPVASKLLEQVVRDLMKSHTCSANTAVVLENVNRIIVKLVVPMTKQGCLAPDEQSRDDVGTDSSALETSAMAEAEALAKVTAKISKAAIDVAHGLVDHAEKSRLDQEEASQHFQESKDEKVSRRTFARAAGKAQKLEYLDDEKTLGGNHDIPKKVLSSAMFSLKNCSIYTLNDNSNLFLNGDNEDSAWREFVACYGYGVNEIDADSNSSTALLLRFAHAARQPVNMDICISENISNKKRKVVPIKITNHMAIISRVQDHLEQMTTDRLFD